MVCRIRLERGAASAMNLTPPKPLDAGTRLAVDRTRLAYERTLMAWVRTATSLISFGFTIYKFFEFESGRGGVAATASRLLSPRQFGMIMITTGLAALALATIDHHRNMRRMQDEYGMAGRSVAIAVAVIVSGLLDAGFVAAALASLWLLVTGLIGLDGLIGLHRLWHSRVRLRALRPQRLGFD